jgi:hypothetical protein
MKPHAPAIHVTIVQALPKGGLPFTVSLPQSSTLQVGEKAHFPISMLNAEQQQEPLTMQNAEQQRPKKAKNFVHCIYCKIRLDDPNGCIHAAYKPDKTDTALDVVTCLRKGCERSLRAKHDAKHCYRDVRNHERRCRPPKGAKGVKTHQKSDYEQYEWAGTTPRLHRDFICVTFVLHLARLPACQP